MSDGEWCCPGLVRRLVPNAGSDDPPFRHTNTVPLQPSGAPGPTGSPTFGAAGSRRSGRQSYGLASEGVRS